MVDCGDSTSRALLNSGIDINEVDGILISHFHPDHFAGLPSLIVQMKMNNRKNELDIFTGKNQINFIRQFILNSGLIPERMNFKINYHQFTSNDPFDIKPNLKILPSSNNHLSELKNYPGYKNISFDSFSFMISENEKNIVYTSDIGSVDDLYLFKKTYADLFIAESTHIPFHLLIEAFNKLNAGKLILTHIPDESESGLTNLVKEANDRSGRIIIASDGLEFDL